jgi:hypothetical protein
MKGEKLVLRHKASGKIASRRDQESKALTLHAQQLTASGEGGGIVALRLPTSVKDKNEMVRIGETYSVSRVKARPGNNAETSDKKQLQAALTNDELITRLAELYGKHIGEKPGPHTISSKAFTGWLKKELKNTKSIAYKTALKLAPVLLEVERNDRWWESAFAERRKTQS